MLPHDPQHVDQVRRSSDDTASTLLPLESCSSGSPASVAGDVVTQSEGNSRHADLQPVGRPGSVERELRPSLQRSDPLEIEDIEDSDLEEEGPAEPAPHHSRGVKLATVNVPTFASGDVKCTCAKGAAKGHVPTPGCKVKGHTMPSHGYEVKGHTPTPGVKGHVPTPGIKDCAPTPGVNGRMPTPEVRGRVPTPELRKSTSPMRHHLDLTTPSDNGLLIPMTTYTPTSPNFRRDKSTAPINPLPVDDVDRLIEDCRKAMEPAREEEKEVSSVPKHIPASSSPHHSHCVPRDVPRSAETAGRGARPGIGGGTKGEAHKPHARTKGARGATTVSQHVRKLNFERPAPSQTAPKRTQSSYQPRPTSMPRPSAAPSLSCHTCGVSLQPSIPPPPSSAPPGDGRPKAQTLYPAPLNARPASTLNQSKHIPTGAVERGSRRSACSQRQSASSPTPPPSRANVYAPTTYGGRVSQLKPSFHRNLEVDELSLSSMSLSSCSVASEVLEKAKRRRDNFWTSQQQSRE